VDATFVVRALDHAVRFGALALLLVIIVVVCAGVVARYVFNASFTWTEEFGSLAFIWLTFVGVAAGHRDEQHVAIRLFEGNREGLAQTARRLLIDLVVAYTTLWLFYGGLQLVESIGGTSPALGWPNAIKYIVVPAGCLISLAYIVLADGTLPRMVRSLVTVIFAWITLGLLADAIGQLVSTASPSPLGKLARNDVDRRSSR
jgi:TRAP-type C4-dicarboxylate transport system permease small subunit